MIQHKMVPHYICCRSSKNTKSFDRRSPWKKDKPNYSFIKYSGYILYSKCTLFVWLTFFKKKKTMNGETTIHEVRTLYKEWCYGN